MTALVVSKYPSVTRDFTFEIATDITSGCLTDYIHRCDKHIEEVAPFDVYTGRGVAPGNKAFSVSVRMTSFDHTFKKYEIGEMTRKIIKAAENLGGILKQ